MSLFEEAGVEPPAGSPLPPPSVPPDPNCTQCGGSGVWYAYRHGQEPENYPEVRCSCTWIKCDKGTHRLPPWNLDNCTQCAAAESEQ